MPGRRDEVQQSMNTVISETGVTFDTRLFSKNIVVLTLKIANDLLEAEATEGCQLCRPK